MKPPDPNKFFSEMIAEANDLDSLAEPLRRLLKAGFGVWSDGSLYHIRRLVDRVDGLRIEIYPNEHPPPHFHVRSGSVNASFAIDDCRFLKGSVARQQVAVIQWWHQRARAILVEVWNEMRPSDCPVGPIRL